MRISFRTDNYGSNDPKRTGVKSFGTGKNQVNVIIPGWF